MMHWCWSMTFTEYHGWGCGKVSGAVVEQYLQAWRDLYLYCWGVFTSLRGPGCKKKKLSTVSFLQLWRDKTARLTTCIGPSISERKSELISNVLFKAASCHRLDWSAEQPHSDVFGMRKTEWEAMSQAGAHLWLTLLLKSAMCQSCWSKKCWLILKLWCEGQMFNLNY